MCLDTVARKEWGGICIIPQCPGCEQESIIREEDARYSTWQVIVEPRFKGVFELDDCTAHHRIYTIKSYNKLDTHTRIYIIFFSGTARPIEVKGLEKKRRVINDNNGPQNEQFFFPVSKENLKIRG